MPWTRIIFSAGHVLALGIGLGAVVGRGRAFERGDLEAALWNDNWWGVSAVLFLITGLTRAFGGLEKGTEYYLASDAFWLKMSLFALIWALEAVPMITLIRWRVARAKGQPVDVSVMPRLAALNRAEVAVTALIPFVAAAMARGA